MDIVSIENPLSSLAVYYSEKYVGLYELASNEAS